ncbi:MAG: hypothetical protein ABW072_05175, partial [Sedimenticola sp.]
SVLNLSLSLLCIFQIPDADQGRPAVGMAVSSSGYLQKPGHQKFTAISISYNYQCPASTIY